MQGFGAVADREATEARCTRSCFRQAAVLPALFVLAAVLVGALAAQLAGRDDRATRTKQLLSRLSLSIKDYESSFGDYPPGAPDEKPGGVESAESLYRCLTSPKLLYPQEFDEGELADTDGDGRREIVDRWGHPLSYHHHRSYKGPPMESTFRVFSSGPDGEAGTEDDVWP